jgi:chloramphenicol 3-O-phosphotransferase
MTPEEADARRQRFEALSGPDGPLSSRSPRASVSNREFYTEGGRPTDEREQLHDRLLADFEAEATAVPQNRQVVIITGPPGAGKSGVRNDILKDTGTAPEQWRHIDSDAFRDRLSGAMQEDGTLGQLVPPEAVELQPTQRELSSQLFVESAKLATAAQKKAIDRGDNLIIEGVYSDPKRLESLVKSLEKKGYDVHLATVDVSHDDCLERTQDRYRQAAIESAASGVEGQEALGGRFVSAASLEGHFDEAGNSKATQAAQQVAAQRPGVQSLRQYTVPAADQPAQLWSVAQRQGGLEPVDAQTYQAARAAGMMEALPSAQGAAEQGAPGQASGKGTSLGRGERPEHRQRQQGGPNQTLHR